MGGLKLGGVRQVIRRETNRDTRLPLGALRRFARSVKVDSGEPLNHTMAVWLTLNASEKSEMKTPAEMTRLPLVLLVLASAAWAAPLKSVHPPGYDEKIVHQHRLLRPSSVVPSCVELVLKLGGRVPADFYELQHAWLDNAGGSFHDFDGSTIAGLTFHQRFTHERGPGFPLPKLFAAIDEELRNGRYVVVGLRNEPDLNSFSARVIVERNAAGEYQAVTKNDNDTVIVNDFKARITRMQGTDLGVWATPAHQRSARSCLRPMAAMNASTRGRQSEDLRFAAAIHGCAYGVRTGYHRPR